MMQSKGRVLMLSTSMGIGGAAEEQVMQLALEMDRRGWKTQIVSMHPPEELPEELGQRGIAVHTLGASATGLPGPFSISRLARQWREFRPDIVHTHMTEASLLGRVTRLFQKGPALVSTRRDFRDSDDPGFGRRLNCIDTELFRPDAALRETMRAALGLDPETTGFVWISVGRLEASRNYPLLFEAFARVAAVNDVLLLCGRGRMTSKLQRRVSELGIENQVRFLGVRPDIADVLNAADGFVMSSSAEGLPMVMLQAAATALPVVATNVGANSEIVRHGLTGFLTPSGEPEPLGGAMSAIAAMSYVQRTTMGLAGRAHVVANYDLQSVADRWEELYTRLLVSSPS